VYRGATQKSPAPLLELSLLQVDGRGLSSITAFALEANPLTFVQIADTRALDRRYMNEHVLQAVFRLNEAVTPPGIEPLNGSDSHCFPYQNGIAAARKRAGVELRHGAGSRSGARLRAWESKPNRRGVDIKTDKFSGLALSRGGPFSPPTQ
jgi:hypothetical protein